MYTMLVLCVTGLTFHQAPPTILPLPMPKTILITGASTGIGERADGHHLCRCQGCAGYVYARRSPRACSSHPGQCDRDWLDRERCRSLITFGASFLGCFGRFPLPEQSFRGLKPILSHRKPPRSSKNGDSRAYELAPTVNNGTRMTRIVTDLTSSVATLISRIWCVSHSPAVSSTSG